MTRRPFARFAVAAAAALVVTLLAAPSAAPGPGRGALAGPKNLRVAAITPHSVTLAWDPAVNSGSFTYVIEASFGYRVGVRADADELHVDARHDPRQDLLVRDVGGRREGPGVREEQHADGDPARRHDAAGRARRLR